MQPEDLITPQILCESEKYLVDLYQEIYENPPFSVGMLVEVKSPHDHSILIGYGIIQEMVWEEDQAEYAAIIKLSGTRLYKSLCHHLTRHSFLKPTIRSIMKACSPPGKWNKQ